jgi:hypothetical protein
MEHAILNLLEGSNKVRKLSTAEICKNVLEILVDVNTKHYSFEFAHRDAIEQYAKDRFVEKHGSLEPLSWEADAYDMGSISTSALRAGFDRSRTQYS